MWASQLPQDFRVLRSDETASQDAEIANRIFQYEEYTRPSVDPEAIGALSRQIPFDNPLLVQKLESLLSDSVMLSPRDKESVRRFLVEGCWEGMSATDVRAIQKLLAQALSPVQQTKMGLAIDDIRQLTHVKSLMGTRHEPLSETAAQMRDDLLSAYGISESEQKFRSSMHLIDVQADGVRVLADELLRTGQLTPQSSLTEIAQKSLSLVQNRFQYIKEATDPDGTEQDRWQSIDETMRKGGGDCEDLAMLQASLLMNLMEQMGYSKKEIRDRVYISGGYMFDSAGNQKGHVLVRLQMNDGDLALDATGDKAPQRFDSLNFDVVFEANDWKFNALQTIDPTFVTSLDVTGSTADSIASRIDEVMEALQEQLKTRIDIPLPKTDYSSGAADFFGFGTEDIMQREILDADGRGTGNMQDIYSTTEFSFFTLHYSTYSPPFVNNRMYLAEIKEDFFLNYINMTRNLTNELLMLYHIGNSYLDFIANEATEIGMSGYDEQTKGAMQEVMDSGDKYKGKVVGALNSYLQKTNDYIQKVASDVFGFVDSNNSAQLQMAQYKIDNWGRESLFTALPSAIVDQLTNALQMERIISKVAITEKVAKMAANNMTSYINYSRDMTEGVRFWTEGTSQSEVVNPGALNFGQTIWNEMEGVTGSKAKYLAYLDKMQLQVDQIKSRMSSSPTYSATYGLTESNMNKDPLEGELFGAHGDIKQFVQTNMDQMAKLYEHNVEFQNMVGIAFMIRQTIQDTQRELSSSIAGKKGTSSSGQIGGAALSSLGAELAKQSTSLNLIQSAAGNLSAQATDLMVQRINYEKEVRTTIAKAVKWVVEIAGAILGEVLGFSVGVGAAVGYSAIYASPWLALMSNPFTLAAGIAGYISSFAAALPVYTDLWSDYFSRNTSNTVSAIAELVYSGVQYSSELSSKEIGTTQILQEGDTFGREENGASDSGAALAAAEQSNTDIWSEGERDYLVNSAEAKILMARDSYNMEVNAPIRVGGVANGTASGPRNTQRTEFIADRGDGQVLLNGLLMGSRESDTAMLQGSVYALMGIFRAQRDAMENLISQAFGVQKANKSNAMAQQIGYSVGLEQQLIGMYKQDSNQRIQAMNMLASEDKRQTDYIKEMVTKGLKVGVAALGWANVPIPLLSPVPPPTATAVYHGVNAVINVANTVIELGDALYKYDLGPYSANFASYHDRSLNDSEDAYRDELKAAVTDPVPSAEGLTTAERYERLDQLEDQQMAKMIDYGGGVGEWGDNLHDDSILEYSNELAEGITLPFRQVNYGNASRVYNEITEITSLRVFYAMIEQALYQQKQNTLRLMIGTSSAASPISTMMQILDSYNSAVLNGTYDSLLQEAGSRATSVNAYENNTVAKSIEYSVIGATLLVNIPTLFRAAKVPFGGTGYAGAQANVKALARAGSALKLLGAAAKMGFGFMLMYTVKGSNPNVDSAMASYDEDEEGNPTEKNVDDEEQKITRSSGGQKRVSSADKSRAQTLARRRERQITLMREIGLAVDNAKADAAEDVGGISSSKSFNSITKIIGTMAMADVKQADFTYQALKQQADAYNRGVQQVVEGAATVVSEILSYSAGNSTWNSSPKTDKSQPVKGQTGTAGSNSSNVKSKESKNAESSNARSSLWQKLDKGLNSVITQALIESAMWLLAMGEDKEFYSPFASDESNAEEKVDGDSEANSGESGGVASTDNLENAILGISLMQANTALLREIQGDRIQLASKMAASPAGFLKKAIDGAFSGAAKDKVKKNAAKQEEQDLDDLAEMDEDEFKKGYEAFMNPQVDAAVARTDNLAKKFDDILLEKGEDTADLRDTLGKNFTNEQSALDKKYEEKHGKGFLTSGDPDVKKAYDNELKGAKAKVLLNADAYSGKDIARDAVKNQPEGFGPKGPNARDAMAFAVNGTSLDDNQRRFLTLQKRLGVGTPEEMYAKLQEDRAKKNAGDSRKNVGSTTMAEAQAGMASKDGLASARKQLSEVAKLEKSQEEKALREVGIVDVGSLSDGDPGEGDSDKRKNKKENAKKDYLGEDNVLNAKFYALDGPAQAQALKDMGMSHDAAAPLFARIYAVKEGLKEPGDVAQIAALTAAGVSSEKAAEIVADIKDLRELKALLREAAEVGKVPDTEALKDARTTLKGTAQQLLRGGEDISKYVGSDKRLNQKFYALDKKKQADTLIKMGLASTPEEAKSVAAGGTQAAQDSKLSAVKAKMADIAAKQSARLDGQDASLNIQAQALQSGLDSGAESLAVLARNSGAAASASYIADDGSVKPLSEAAAGSTVSLVLMRADSPDQKAVVQVSKKALEKLDFTKPETQATLAGLDGLGGGGDIALVSDIEGISQQDIFDKQKGMSRELSGVQKSRDNLSGGGTASEMRTLQALGRMEKLNLVRDVEMLGAELLRREGSVSIEDLALEPQANLALPESTLADAFSDENLEFGALSSNLESAGLIGSDGKATEHAKSLGPNLRDAISTAASSGAGGMVLLNAGSLDAITEVLSGQKDEDRQSDLMGRLQSAGLVDRDGKVSASLSGMSEESRNNAIDRALGVAPGAPLMPGLEADRDAARVALSGGARRKEELTEQLKTSGLIDKYGNVTESTKGKSETELHAAIGVALDNATPQEKNAVYAVLSGQKNQDKKEAVTARLRDLQDGRPGERQALRKEIEDLRSGKKAEGLDKLSPEAKKKLTDANILNADGSLNAKEVARLQADPEAADAVFSNIAGTNGAALKNAVFGQAKEEKLKKLEKKLAAMEVDGLRAMGLDPELTPSARIRLAANDAKSDPNKVREILQAQAAEFREQALTEAEARDNLKEESPFSRKAPVSSAALFGLRVGGAIVTAGATEIAMALNGIKRGDAAKAEKAKEKDLDRALAAKDRKIDRVAAAKKFQEDVDQVVGVDANARVAGEFVDTYKKAVGEAKESSKKAQIPTQGTIGGIIWGVPTPETSLQNKDDKEAAIDKTDTNVLKALVAERDAAVKIRKLVKEGDSAQAADILRHIAGSGEEGQALAAGVLRRLAANGDDVRDLLDRAAAGARPDQLRGLGAAVVQAMGQDNRFAGLQLTENESGFDAKLGALYGMSGWHTNTDADKKAPVGSLQKWWDGKAKASAKSERGASALADALVGSKGLNKILASASQKDLAALGNLSTDSVSSLLKQLSSEAKSRPSDDFTAGIDDTVGRDPSMDGGVEADLPSEHEREAFSMDIEMATLLMEDMEIDIEDRAFGATVSAPLSSEDVRLGMTRRDTQMDALEQAFKQVMRKGPSLENAQAVSAALASVRDRGDVGEAVRLLTDSATSPAKTRLTDAEKQNMLRESGQLLVEVSDVLQSDLASDLKNASTIEDQDSLRGQSKGFVTRSKGLLTELDRDGAENRLQAQQAVVNVMQALRNVKGVNAAELQALLPPMDPDPKKAQAELFANIAPVVAAVTAKVAEGLKTNFTETTVQSAYFKKLDEAVVRPGYESGSKIDGTVTSLAEISQKLKQDPVGAGAELDNVKDRVATVIEAAVSQGHVDDVLRVLGQLSQAGLSDLVKDLGVLVAVRGDGDLALAALDTRAKSLFDTPEEKRTQDQQRYIEGLSDFKIGVLDKDSRVVDKMVQAQVDTAKKEVALRDIAHKMASGDVALVEAVLANSALRQDLALLVAQGVALDMPSAYRILSVIGEKPQKEAAQFAEAVGIRLAAINVDIKTSSRKVDLKKVGDQLKEMAKTEEAKKSSEAFSKQMEQGYGVQLYTSAPLMGLSRGERLQVLNTLVQTKSPQKAEGIFRDLAMRNPQAAANLMTDAISRNMPNLANTMYQGISKEIPGANGRTLNQIDSLIKAFKAEDVPLSVALSAEYLGVSDQMNLDMTTIATAQREQDIPKGSVLFNAALAATVTVEGGELSIPEGKKPIALAHVQQDASRMEAQVADLPGAASGAEAFAKLKSDPGSMTLADFSALNTLAGELPPTQAREMRLQVGLAAMAVLPEGSPLGGQLMQQQVTDMIAVGHGAMFSSQMVADALASRVDGKLDALETLLTAKADPSKPDLLDLTQTAGFLGESTLSKLMTALMDPGVDMAQRNALLRPGGSLDKRVGEQLDGLSLDTVIAFTSGQVSAGVSLQPSHFYTKLESEARKLDDAKGDAVKAAMTEVANGTQTLQAALTALGTGALAGTPLETLKDNRSLQTLDALGELKSGMAELPQLAADLADLQASGMAPQSVVDAQQDKVDSAKSKILTFLSDPGQSAMLKEQQPGLYLSAMATPGLPTFGLDAADVNAVRANGAAVQAYLAPTVTTETITNMEPLISGFMAGDAQSMNALVLIASADAGSARPKLPMILANIPGVDTRDLAAKLSGLSGAVAAGNLGASSSLSSAATVLRDKAAVGSHTALKDLAQKALRHHHKGQSYERELSSMSGHVLMHKESFMDAMKTTPYNLDQADAEKSVDKNASSEGGIPGMLTLLDAQEKTMSALGSVSAADAKTMKMAKMALAEVYIDTLIKDDTESISGMDRKLATVLVDSLKDGMNEIMPRLKHRLQSAESTERLMTLIGQSNIPLTGDGGMGELRADIVKASGIFDMTSPASAAATLGIVQQDTDLAAKTLSLYTDPKDAAEVLNKLVAYQDGDAAFAGGLLGRMPEPNLNGPAAQNYWNNLFGSLDFAQDAPSLAALRSGIQSPILAERFNVYLGTLPGGMAAQVSSFQFFVGVGGMPTTLDTPAEKAQLRLNVAMTMGQSPGALPGTMAQIKQEAMAMLGKDNPYADKALNEMMANPQARAMLGRFVAEDPAVRVMVADIVAGSQLPPSTLPGVLKLPGVAAELRSRPMETAVDGLLMAKVMVEPSLVSQLDASDLGVMTNALLLSGDPMGVLPHLMEHPGAMEMIGSTLMGGASHISQDQAMQLVGLARNGQDLGALLGAVPSDKLASVLGSPTFLEGRSDKMAMLDTAISTMIGDLSAGDPAGAMAGFDALSSMLDMPTYGGRNGTPGMSMDGVPKGVKLLIIKHMIVQGHEGKLEDKHLQSYESGFRPVLGSSENTSWLGSLESGSPDIFLLEDALVEASRDPAKLNSVVSDLEAAVSNPATSKAVVDFLTTSFLGKSMMVRLNAMASTDSTVLEGLQTKLESANFDRLSSALDSAVTPEAFTHMAQSGVLLSTDQKTALAEKFVAKYPAGSADADAALHLLFES